MKYTKLGLFSVAIMITSQISNGATALLFDAYGTADPTTYQDWVDAGVTEADSTSAGGTVISTGVLYNMSGGISWSLSGVTNKTGAATFPGNDMLNDYIYVNQGTVTASITGLGNTLTSSLGDMTGNTFTLQTNQAYKLYLFGAGDQSDQNTSFTYGGVTKTTAASIVGTADDAGHFVTYEFTTGADVSGFTLDFTYTNTGTTGNDRYAAFNGLAIVEVPEPSSAALLGLGGLALILRRRK